MFHILVADDDKNTRMLFKAVLEAENYTVLTAENGEEALSVMDSNHVDLVVLDVMMPKMDGYEFTRTLRQGILPVFRSDHMIVFCLQDRPEEHPCVLVIIYNQNIEHSHSPLLHPTHFR